MKTNSASVPTRNLNSITDHFRHACSAWLLALIWLVMAPVVAHAGDFFNFPIAPSAAAMGYASDGTNYLVGLENPQTHAIGAQMISPNGTKIGPLIPTGRTGIGAAVAFDGTNYLMIWEDDELGAFIANDAILGFQIYGQFISKTGVKIGAPFAISTTGIWFDGVKTMAFGGGAYLVTYTRLIDPALYDDATNRTIAGRIVQPNGTMDPEFRISTGFGAASEVAFDGTNFCVVWCEDFADQEIRGRLVSPAGVLGPEFQVNASPENSDSIKSIAFDGSNYLVVWNDLLTASASWASFGQRIRTDGSPIGDVIAITNEPGSQVTTSIAYDQSNYLVVTIDMSDDANWDAYGQYISNDGTLVGDMFTISDDLKNQLGFVGFGNGKYLVLLANGISFTPEGTVGQVDSSTGTFLVPPVGDNFNDNIKNPAKWGNDSQLGGTAPLLQEINGRLEFTKASTDESAVFRPWIYRYGSYTQSWEVAVDAHLGNITLPVDGAYVNMNLIVSNRSDTQLVNGMPGDAMSIALDLYRDGGELFRGYEMYSKVNGIELGNAPNDAYAATNDEKGRLKISFDATTKVLTSFYNNTVLGSLDVDAPNSNWTMTAASTFQISLAGGSGLFAVPSGAVDADNFTLATYPTGPLPVPVITWLNPAAISYGTALSAIQLNAKANVPGKFFYTPALGEKLPLGVHSLSTTFIPTDPIHYADAQKSVSLTVNKAAAVVAITGLSQVYNGQAKPVTVTTVPPGLQVQLTYNGSTEVPVNAGSYQVSATIVDANASGAKTGNLIIAKGKQTITFPALPVLRYGDPDCPLTASASSNLPVNYISSAPTVATIVNGKLHILGAGNVVITASQPGDTNWLPATLVSKTIAIGKKNQSIDFPAFSNHVMGDADFDPGASASSGLPITYTSSAPTVATIVNGKVHLIGKGSAVITATQVGNASWAAALPVKQTLSVGIGSQTITFNAMPDKGFGDPDFSPATASSGLPITYTSSNLLVCSVLNGKIHITGTGTTTITAKQAGNANWSPASEVTQALNVGKGTPLITWANPLPIIYGTALSAAQLNAKTNVLGQWTYAPTIGTKLPVGTHALMVTFTPTDTTRYLPSQKSVLLTVNKAAATVVLTGLNQIYNGQARSVIATTVPAGLNVNLTYAGSTEVPINAGQYPVVATVNDPNASGTKSGMLVIAKGNQTIAFGSLPVMRLDDVDLPLTASATSSLPVTYTSSAPTVATIVAGKIHVIGAGTTSITATQPGNSNWNAALAVRQSLTVSAALLPSPAVVTAFPGNGSVSVTWYPVTGATSYRIYWSTTSGVSKSNGTKITATASPYTHAARTNGTTYYYVVTAVNAAGESMESNQTSATPTSVVDSTQIMAEIWRSSNHDGSVGILYFVSIKNNGIGVRNAIVSVNGTIVPHVVGFVDGDYRLEDWQTPHPNYVPGQNYTVTVQYNGKVYTDSLKAPGGFSANADYTQAQWEHNGMYATLDVAHLFGSTTYTRPYAKPGPLSSPQIIPASAYPSTGTYTLHLWTQNIKEKSFDFLRGNDCRINITDSREWRINK